MKNIVIYGENEFAQRIFSYITFENVANVLAFTNAKDFKDKDRIQNVPVIAFEDLKEAFPGIDFGIIIAVGYGQMNNIRRKIYQECKDAGFNIATFISTRSVLYSQNIEEGCIIMPNVYIGPSCRIGKGNIIASSCCFSHDNELDDFNFISSSVVFGGNAKVGNNCFIGLNSTIKSGVKISDYSLIGSASNVLKDTEQEGVYVGNPARQLLGKVSITAKI